MNKNEFGKILEDLQARKNVSNDTVAEYIGVTKQSYSNYRAGLSNPNFEKLIRIADYFNVTTDYLLGRTIKEKVLQNVIHEPREVYGNNDANALARIIKDLTMENVQLEMKLKECLSGNEKNISSNVSVAKLG